MITAALLLAIGAILGLLAVISMIASKHHNCREENLELKARVIEAEEVLEVLQLIANDHADIDPYTAPAVLVEVSKYKKRYKHQMRFLPR